MLSKFSGLRCRLGDLALVVGDEPECLANIGQVVRVIDVYREFPAEWGFHWLVQPLSSLPSPVLIEDVRTRDKYVVYDNDPRAYLDCWLKPLRDMDETAELTKVAKLSNSELREKTHL
jgi:hypothetical protein